MRWVPWAPVALRVTGRLLFVDVRGEVMAMAEPDLGFSQSRQTRQRSLELAGRR